MDEIVNVFDQLWPSGDAVETRADTLLGRLREITSTAVARSLQPVELGPGFERTSSLASLEERYGLSLDPGRFADRLCKEWVDAIRDAAPTTPELQPWADQLNFDLTHLGIAATQTAVRDLRTAVERAVPSPDTTGPPYWWPGVRSSEYAARTEAVLNRNAQVLEREEYLAELRGATASPPGLVSILGVPFAGKTALLAELVRQLRQTDGIVLLAFFANAPGDEIADLRRSLVNQCLDYLGLPGTGGPASELASQLSSLLSLLEPRLAESATRLVVVIDALDELPGHEEVVRTVRTLFRTATVVTSARPYYERHLAALGDPVSVMRLPPNAHSRAVEYKARRFVENARRGNQTILNIMAVLAVASRPITRPDLADLLRIPIGEVNVSVEPFRTEIELPDGLGVTHTQVRQWLLAAQEITASDPTALFASWVERWAAAHWPDTTPRYLTDGITTELGDPWLAAGPLADVGYCSLSLRRSTVRRLLEAIDAWIEWVNGEGEHSDEQLVRLAEIGVNMLLLRRSAHVLPPSVLADIATFDIQLAYDLAIASGKLKNLAAILSSEPPEEIRYEASAIVDSCLAQKIPITEHCDLGQALAAYAPEVGCQLIDNHRTGKITYKDWHLRSLVRDLAPFITPLQLGDLVTADFARSDGIGILLSAAEQSRPLAACLLSATMACDTLAALADADTADLKSTIQRLTSLNHTLTDEEHLSLVILACRTGNPAVARSISERIDAPKRRLQARCWLAWAEDEYTDEARQAVDQLLAEDDLDSTTLGTLAHLVRFDSNIAFRCLDRHRVKPNERFFVLDDLTGCDLRDLDSFSDESAWYQGKPPINSWPEVIVKELAARGAEDWVEQHLNLFPNPNVAHHQLAVHYTESSDPAAANAHIAAIDAPAAQTRTMARCAAVGHEGLRLEFRARIAELCLTLLPSSLAPYWKRECANVLAPLRALSDDPSGTTIERTVDLLARIPAENAFAYLAPLARYDDTLLPVAIAAGDRALQQRENIFGSGETFSMSTIFPSSPDLRRKPVYLEFVDFAGLLAQKGLSDEALGFTRRIPSPTSQCLAFVEILPYLPDKLGEALAAASSVDGSVSYSRGELEVMLVLASLRQASLTEKLERVASLPQETQSDAWHKSLTESVATFLVPEVAAQQGLQSALNWARSLTVPYYRATAIIRLCDAGPSLRPEVLSNVEECDPSDRVELVVAWFPTDAGAVARAADAAETVDDLVWRFELLASLAACDPQLESRALAAAHAIDDPVKKARGLVDLSIQFAKEQPGTADALIALDHGMGRAWLLGSMIPVVPQARSIATGYCAALNKHRPPGLERSPEATFIHVVAAHDGLDPALEIVNEIRSSQAMASAATRLLRWADEERGGEAVRQVVRETRGKFGLMGGLLDLAKRKPEYRDLYRQLAEQVEDHELGQQIRWEGLALFPERKNRLYCELAIREMRAALRNVRSFRLPAPGHPS